MKIKVFETNNAVDREALDTFLKSQIVVKEIHTAAAAAGTNWTIRHEHYITIMYEEVSQ